MQYSNQATEKEDFFPGFAFKSLISMRYISLQTSCVSVSLRAPPTYNVQHTWNIFP